jgi:hypothetical protein
MAATKAWTIEGIPIGMGDEVVNSLANKLNLTKADAATAAGAAAYGLKIDGAATLGMGAGGVSNSLAYRVHEIERHLHSYERWFGVSVDPNAEVHIADRIGKAESGGAETAFQPDAGNDTWGNWLQILGSSDTPGAGTTNAFYDLHRILVTQVEEANSLYFVQIAFGASGAAAFGANTYTEFPFRALASDMTEIPLQFQTRRIAAGTKAWVRIMCIGKDTAKLSFMFGLHEYEG